MQSDELINRKGKFITDEMLEENKYHSMDQFIENAMEEAKDAIRNYKRCADEAYRIETKRKSLISNFPLDPITGIPIITDEVLALHSDGDRDLLMRYRADKSLINEVDVVINERLTGNDRVIMRELCTRGMTIEEAAQFNGVSRSTVIRARDKMKKAYCDELLHRYAIYMQYPADGGWDCYIDWNEARKKVFEKRCQAKSEK